MNTITRSGKVNLNNVTIVAGSLNLIQGGYGGTPKASNDYVVTAAMGNYSAAVINTPQRLNPIIDAFGNGFFLKVQGFAGGVVIGVVKGNSNAAYSWFTVVKN